MSASRTVHEADAIEWLRQNELPSGSSVLTSLPNVDEFAHRNLDRWRDWFVDTAALVLDKTPQDSATIFFQTDIVEDGNWIDKSFLVQLAAQRIATKADAAPRMIWHKVALRAPIGTTTNTRPGYAHLMCFAKSIRHTRENATPDVLPQLGDMAWPRAMGQDIARAAVDWLREHAHATAIVAPFCGTGTALAVANSLGLHAIGIERNPGRAARARTTW